MRVQNVNNTSVNRNQKPSFASKATMTKRLKEFLGENNTQIFEKGIEKHLKKNGQTNSVEFSLINNPDEAAIKAVVTQKRLFPSRVYEGHANMLLTGNSLVEKDALDLFTKALHSSKLVEN